MKIFPNLLLAISLLITSAFAQDSNSNIELISQAELEQILAPIALYPDTVLSHILIASTYPIEVIQAERWATSNSNLQGSEAVEAVSNEDWDPSVKALVAFPQILKRLSEDLEWTQRLGDAFLQGEKQLLASVQILRQRAYDAGSLDQMDKVSVTREDDSIVIEPNKREVVYLPYYDSRVVYGPWHWSSYPPIYWDYPYYNHHYAGHHDNRFYWGPRVNISFGFFFSSFHWRNHHIVRISNNHYRPHNYYNHNQIVSHQYAERWAHNPSHRRGVAYQAAYINKQKPKQNNINKSQNNSANRTASNVIDHSLVRSNRTRTSAPIIRQELRDNRINRHIQSNRTIKINQNRPTKPAVKPAVVNRVVTQNSRQSSSAQTAAIPSQARTRPATVVNASPPARAAVVRPSNPSKPVKSSRQEPKKQYKPAKVRKQSQNSKRNGVRRNPR